MDVFFLLIGIGFFVGCIAVVQRISVRAPRT